MVDRESLEHITRRWISLWSCPVDWVLFEALHAPDFEDMASAGRPGNKEGFASGIKRLTEAFPDLVTQVDDVLIDVDRQRVAVRWSSRGTNAQAYLGVGPTGKMTRITGIEIIEIKEGKVFRRWGEWDITAHTG